ncbi:MAG TPA: hypothetical protein PL166_13320 [Candidatus Contendobacter sp.]|nr:hypothetical protein [Candidatus Contendobacter sp.]HRD50560.1 hypothetical protein [Candidatus Contendobacter sp.]
MISHTTWSFRKELSKLPASVRSQTRLAYQQFKKDPYYPSLQFKRVHEVKPIYSARINIDYRAVGIMNDNEMIWFWIGAHSEYDKLLKRL